VGVWSKRTTGAEGSKSGNFGRTYFLNAPKMNNAMQQATDLTSFSIFRNRLHLAKALP